MSENEDPRMEEMRERWLHQQQPLLDHGWRVDYKRVGICNASEFIPVAEIRPRIEAADRRGVFDRPPPDRPPGSLLREVTPERRAELAAMPLDDVLHPDSLAYLRGEGMPDKVIRKLIRKGMLAPKVERLIPAEDLKAALDALDSHLSAELWIAMAKYRRAHHGATFEQCRSAILQAGTIREEWGVSDDLWQHYWKRLENEQPYPPQQPTE